MTKAMVVFVLVAAACGGGGGGSNGDDDDQPAVDAATMVQPLTCKSIALCTTYDVRTFIGDVPAPAGGMVHDGIYRLQYVMDPTVTNEQPGYHLGLDALQIRGKYFNWAGFHRDSVGTFTTSGTALTFSDTQNCSRGSDGSSSTSMYEYKYSATATEIRVFSHVERSDGVEWDRMYVYVLASSPADVCKTVSSVPTQPGDSARCTVTNCACNFAVEGTVNACT